MGFLSLFGKPAARLFRLPSGSFTVDKDGRVIASTLPQSFPAALVADIGKQVLATFTAAQAANIQLNELVIRYSTLKLTARELRGGAIVFLAPQTFTMQNN